MLRLNSFEPKALLFLALFFCLSLPSNLYSDDSAASWVENSPGALNCDMLGVATHNTFGTVMVGKDGKSYYMSLAMSKSVNPSWTECISSTQKDFVAIDCGDSGFMALTENGWYTSSISGGTLSWVKKGERSVDQDVCGPFVGLCHASGDVFVAVTSKGYLFRLEDVSEKNVANNRLGDMCASGMVKGIVRMRKHYIKDEKMFFCFGYPGNDGINVLRVRFDGTSLNASPDLHSTIAITESGQGVEINDIDLITKEVFFVAGQNGRFGRILENLFYGDAVSRSFVSTSLLSTPITNNFTSVYIHNGGWLYTDYGGYAVCEGGRIFCSTRIPDMADYIENTSEVAANIYSDDFYAVTMLGVLNEQFRENFFAVGSNGLSVLIEHRPEFVSQKKLSSSDSPFFSSNINSFCSSSESRIFAGGDNGMLYRGDKQADGSFLWTRCRIDQLGAGKVYAIHFIKGFVYVLYASGAGKIRAMKLDTDGNFQSLSTEVTATYKNSASFTTPEDYQLYMGTEAGTYVLRHNAADLDHYGPRPAMNFAALEATDSCNLFMAEQSGAESKIYSSVNGGLGFTTQLLKTYSDTIVSYMLLVGDDLYIAGKDSAADKAFLAKYDGTSFTEFPAGPAGVELVKLWSYGKYIYALGDSNQGYVYNYNTETQVWTSELVNAIQFYGLGGSGEGGFLFAGGDNGRAFRAKFGSGGGGEESPTEVLTKINYGGGEKSSTEVLPAPGEDADLIASNHPVKRSSAELKKQFNTDEGFNPLSNVEDFTTKTTLAAGSVHCFKFNVTPDVSVPVNDCHLYKLISATSSSTDYTRLNGIPAQANYAHGTYWLTDPDGVVKVSGEQLQSGTTYTVFFVIEDNGATYDANPALGTIADPTVFGYSGSGSGGGGCVLDPENTDPLDLAWLFLGIAIVAAGCRNYS